MYFPDNILEQVDHFVNGISIGCSTLLGVCTDKFPVAHGNCFSMKADDGKFYRIVNFYLENLNEGIERKKIELPIRLYILGDPSDSSIAVIYDTRIPGSWYSDEFCQTCTPKKFLSFTQRMRNELKVELDATKVNSAGNIEIGRIGDVVDWRTDKEIEDSKKPIYLKYRPTILEPIIYIGAEIEEQMMAEIAKEIEDEMEKSDEN